MERFRFKIDVTIITGTGKFRRAAILAPEPPLVPAEPPVLRTPLAMGQIEVEPLGRALARFRAWLLVSGFKPFRPGLRLVK
jgi:hypothetical protein